MGLRYQNEIFSISGQKTKQINKKIAEQAYNNGKQLWILPCNMRINNPWQHPMPLSKKGVEDNAFTMGSSFNDIINDFIYYNCDNERGKYPIFFVEA